MTLGKFDAGFKGPFRQVCLYPQARFPILLKELVNLLGFPGRNLALANMLKHSMHPLRPV